MNKGIILFIVEGFSDQNSFENILNELSSDKVKYKIVGGDITTKSNKYTIIKNITKKVQEFLSHPKNKFVMQDIIKIVHLVDIDGVFINNNNIIEDSSIDGVQYDGDKMYVKDKAAIIKRNDNKKQILKKLSTNNCIVFKNGSCIPYESYYFSCNLEHVLHNDANVQSQEKKIELSNVFADRYLGYENKFLEFINDKQISYSGDYGNSWIDIMKESNALNRKTNFNLFFKKDD